MTDPEKRPRSRIRTFLGYVLVCLGGITMGLAILWLGGIFDPPDQEFLSPEEIAQLDLPEHPRSLEYYQAICHSYGLRTNRKNSGSRRRATALCVQQEIHHQREMELLRENLTELSKR